MTSPSFRLRVEPPGRADRVLAPRRIPSAVPFQRFALIERENLRRIERREGGPTSHPHDSDANRAFVVERRVRGVRVARGQAASVRAENADQRRQCVQGSERR